MIAFFALASILSQSQAGIQITVYNGNFAFVRQIHSFDLKKGVQDVALTDVSNQIEAESVALRNLSHPGTINILEQNFQYDLISTRAILEKAIGHQITITRVMPDGQKERVTGTLLSAPNTIGSNTFDTGGMTYSGMVLQTSDGRVILDPTGEVEVASIPEGLIVKPTLLWTLDSAEAGSNLLEVSYLTGGLSWHVDYVLSLDRAGTKGDLKGWLTMRNDTATTFPNAKLKFMAGDVNHSYGRLDTSNGANLSMAGAPRFLKPSEESFADYHLYTVQRPTTLKSHEMKQIDLMEASGVKVERKLELNLSNSGRSGIQTGSPTITLVMKNSKANNLGVPLPEGVFRVFQTDSSGAGQLIGEDSIDGTPMDETIRLRVGTAFDIVGTRRRTEYREYPKANGLTPGYIETYETELRNHKDTAEKVTLIETVSETAKVTKSTVTPTRPTLDQLNFDVEIPAHGSVTLVYTIDTRS